LFPESDINVLGSLAVRSETSFLNIEAGLLVDFSSGAIKVLCVLVDLASWKTPLGRLLPALDEDGMSHIMVEHNGTSDGDACLVGGELFVRDDMVVFEGGKERTLLKDEGAKALEGERWEGRVEGSYEVFVVPVAFFYLEYYALDGFEFFSR